MKGVLLGGVAGFSLGIAYGSLLAFSRSTQRVRLVGVSDEALRDMTPRPTGPRGPITYNDHGEPGRTGLGRFVVT